MKLISRTEVENNLRIEQCIALLSDAMVAVSRGQASQLVRQFLEIPGEPGKMAIMPGTMGDPACFGIKLVCKYHRPPGDPLGTHVGMVMLFDSARGIPLAMVEGSALTGIRTAAASGLATDILARDDAHRLAILGKGEQASRHIDAMIAVRPIDTIVVWGRDLEQTNQFAEVIAHRTGVSTCAAATPAEAVRGADIVCTTTSAKLPFLYGADLEPGQHLNLVGSAIPTTAEVDGTAVQRGRFFVDSRESAMAAAGELLGAIRDGLVDADHVRGEIGEVIDGRVEGRTSRDQITIYKSLGIPAQDLAAAHALWRRASSGTFGVDFDILQ